MEDRCVRAGWRVAGEIVLVVVLVLVIGNNKSRTRTMQKSL
jgi:hypothetical protein